MDIPDMRGRSLGRAQHHLTLQVLENTVPRRSRVALRLIGLGSCRAVDLIFEYMYPLQGYLGRTRK